MRILSKLILARERQPLAQSTWAVRSPPPQKRLHLKLPNGTAIHTALSIPKEFGDLAPPMSDRIRTQLRLILSELKLLIVDEISMVANTTLLHIHQRLKEIFNTPNSELFARISFIAVGDLYQLPPIRRRAVFENYKNDTFNLCHPWNAFKMIELTEIMRQKDDQPFTELLNRFRTGTQTADIQCIQSRSMTHSDSNYPHDALHIWAEIQPVDEYNATRLNQIPAQQYTVTAIDQYPPGHVETQTMHTVNCRLCRPCRLCRLSVIFLLVPQFSSKTFTIVSCFLSLCALCITIICALMCTCKGHG